MCIVRFCEGLKSLRVVIVDRETFYKIQGPLKYVLLTVVWFLKYPQITLSCFFTQKDAPKQTGQNFLLQAHSRQLNSTN